MVKFGKLFRNSQKEGWNKEYINYKTLKKKINEIKNEINSKPLLIENNEELENEIMNNIQSKSEISSYYEENLDKTVEVKSESIKYLKQFLSAVDNEVKKFYLFHSKCERELYVMINSNLHLRNNLQNFKLKDLIREIQILINISNFTIDICDYINLNITALIKILKKYDKKFYKYFGKISGVYFLSRTENKKSDLTYVLEFKIIDEVSAILDDLIQELRYIWNKKNYSNFSKNASYNNLPLINDLAPLNYPVKQYNLKLDELEYNILMIDESNLGFRNKVKMWNIAIKNDNQIVENKSFNSHKNPLSSFLTFHDDNSLNKIFSKNIKRNSLIYDRQIKFNIFIAFVHTFLFNMFYTLNIPTNCELLNKINYKIFYTGFILSLTPIFSFISNVIYTKFNSNPKINRFKISLLFSEFCFILTHFTYLQAFIMKQSSYIYFSRILLGMSNAKVVNRKYLIEHTCRNDSTKFSLYYYLISTLGLACGKLLIKLGPLLSFFFEVFNFEIETNSIIKLNIFTFPSFISLLISSLLVFLTLFFNVNDVVKVNGKIDEIDKNSSIMSRKLTIQEQRMINEIERRLEDYNSISNFSDTNMVAKTIERIETQQLLKCSYTNSNFLFFLFMIFASKLITEYLFIITPYYILTFFKDFYDMRYSSLIQAIVIIIGILKIK